MAKVDYVRPVEAVHGKLAKEDEIGFARMSKANAQEERVKFTHSYRKRKYNPTTAQATHNTAFGAICKMARLRAQDDTKKAADVAGFKAQSLYKTLYQYRWHKAETEYNALAGGGAA